MSNKSELFNPLSSIVDENGVTFFVQDLIEIRRDDFSLLKKNSTALILCNNNLESLFFYINLINHGIVPILIDESNDNILIDKIIANYYPTYIVTPKSLSFQGFTNFFDFRNYSLLQSGSKFDYPINKNLSLLLSTSGSVGSPKMVRLSYENIYSNSKSISNYLNLDSNDKALTILPMNYSFGLSIINSHLLVGGKIVLTKKSIIQRDFWDLFKKYEITSISGVPYTFEILKKIKFERFKLPSLRYITQAGGKLPEDLIFYYGEYANSQNLDFFIMYGQTECTARLSYLDPSQTLKKVGSIGKAIPGGEFILEGNDGSIITEKGIIGELTYKGPNVMLGYAESYRELSLDDELNNFIKTGDLAYMDAEKFYYISGRKKRFIKLFGNRVNLDELEQTISNAVCNCACIGTDLYLELFITEFSEKEKVKTFVSKILKINSNFFSVNVISHFPLNKNGKIQYNNLGN